MLKKKENFLCLTIQNKSHKMTGVDVSAHHAAVNVIAENDVKTAETDATIAGIDATTAWTDAMTAEIGVTTAGINTPSAGINAATTIN